MVKESTPGMMAASIMETGKTIIWMASVSTLGKTEESTRANTKRTKNMEMEYTPGLMAESMTESGKMEDNTAKASIYQSKANIDPASGKMVKERDG